MEVGSQPSLQNFSAIDSYQHRSSDKGLNRWDSRFKLGLLILVSVLNVFFAQTWLSISLWLLGLVLVVYSRVPFRLFIFFFLAPAWATILVCLGFAMGFGNTPLVEIGPIVLYRQGIDLAVSAAVRVACEMTWMAGIFITTPIYAIIEALYWFRVPSILIESLALTYRYVFLLFDEFQRMLIAARSRGGMYNLKTSLRSLSMIIAQVFLRTYDRSQRVHAAIMARGGE